MRIDPSILIAAQSAHRPAAAHPATVKPHPEATTFESLSFPSAKPGLAVPKPPSESQPEAAKTPAVPLARPGSRLDIKI